MGSLIPPAGRRVGTAACGFADQPAIDAEGPNVGRRLACEAASGKAEAHRAARVVALVSATSPSTYAAKPASNSPRLWAHSPRKLGRADQARV